MSDTPFRPLCAADEAVFLEMAEEFYHSNAVLHPIPPEYHRVAFQEMLSSDRYLAGYLLEQDGKAAGFAVTNRMMQHEAGGFVIWIEELYLRKEFRGSGLGSRFLNWIEQQMRGKAKLLRLETEPENTRAQQLYARLGYQPLKYSQMIKEL